MNPVFYVRYGFKDGSVASAYFEFLAAADTFLDALSNDELLQFAYIDADHYFVDVSFTQEPSGKQFIRKL